MENMKFYGLLDFYPKKEEIKKNYDLLTVDEIIQYKMYVYSLPTRLIVLSAFIVILIL